jgi:hypothetical protein
MADRMAERAKFDIDRILQQLNAVAPDIDRIARACEIALRVNLEAEGDYISPRTVKAVSEMRSAVAALYTAGQSLMVERDRFFGRQQRPK